MEQILNSTQDMSQQYNIEKPIIKECYIAYLDILGYKAFFEQNPEMINNILDIINKAIGNIMERLQIVNEIFYRNSNMIKNLYKIRVFSDNILVYYECNNNIYESKKLLLSFIELIKDFQISLIMSYGIFLRGGITKGQFAANEMFVFGQGLIDAVTLEEKQAIFPRIVIQKSIIDDLNAPIIFKIIFENSDIYRLLNHIDNLFISTSSKELYDRITQAYSTFHNIILLIPEIYQKRIDAATNLCENLKNQIKNIELHKDDIEYMKNEYQNIKVQLLPQYVDIFNQIAQYQINKDEELNLLRKNSCLFVDSDGLYIINYLELPDYSDYLLPEKFNIIIDTIKVQLPEYPVIAEEMEILADTIKSQNYLLELVTNHKNRIEFEINNCMAQYKLNKDKKQKLSDIEKVIKKYIWSMQYHNSICDKNEFNDIKINYSIDFDPIDNIILVKI